MLSADVMSSFPRRKRVGLRKRHVGTAFVDELLRLLRPRDNIASWRSRSWFRSSCCFAVDDRLNPLFELVHLELLLFELDNAPGRVLVAKIGLAAVAGSVVGALALL